MGYRISRQYKGGSMTLYLQEHGFLASKSTEVPEMATLFKYDAMVSIMAAQEGWTAEFVPQTEGEREFDKGTLWLTSKMGKTYRLIDYGPDFKAEDPWAVEIPAFDVQTADGGNYTVWGELPPNARLIWHPEGK